MRVLYLEDDPLDAEAFKRAVIRLRPHIELETFVSPTQALARLRETATESAFDTVVIDVSLPEMNGFEFLDRLNALIGSAKRPHIVVFTSSEHRIDLAEAKRTRAHAYVVKTADPRCFEDLVMALDGLRDAALRASAHAVPDRFA